MTRFDFKTWCSDHGLKQKTIDKLGKSDLDSWTEETPATRLSRTEWCGKNPQGWRDETNRNSVCHYQDIGERWPFKRATEKIGGVSLDDPFVTLGATEQPLFSCPSRGLTTTCRCSLAYRTRRKVRQNHLLFPTL